MRKTLEKAGYSVHYDILNASNFGIPQKHERVYFVCLRKDQSLAYSSHKETRHEKFLSDILLPANECEGLIITRNDIVITNRTPGNALKPVRVAT